jgi:hypothetical protein
LRAMIFVTSATLLQRLRADVKRTRSGGDPEVRADHAARVDGKLEIQA